MNYKELHLICKEMKNMSIFKILTIGFSAALVTGGVSGMLSSIAEIITALK
nr:hypothetical protein 18 [bacterium]